MPSLAQRLLDTSVPVMVASSEFMGAKGGSGRGLRQALSVKPPLTLSLPSKAADSKQRATVSRFFSLKKIDHHGKQLPLPRLLFDTYYAKPNLTVVFT